MSHFLFAHQSARYAFQDTPTRADAVENQFVVHDIMTRGDIVITSAVESRTEEDWVETNLKCVLPPPDRLPLRRAFGLNHRGGRTTRNVFLVKWLWRALTVASLYVALLVVYRAHYLPQHSPLHEHIVKSQQSSSLPSSIRIMNNTRTTFASAPLTPAWFPSSIADALNPRVGAAPACNRTIRGAPPFQLGGYRIECAPLHFVPMLGTYGFSLHTNADALVALIMAAVVWCLKAQLFFFLFESLDIFNLRLDMLRNFNRLSSLPVSAPNNPIDWLTAPGLRRWFQLRQRVLSYYESRHVALQTASAALFVYTLCVGVYLGRESLADGRLPQDDLGLFALLDLGVAFVFFAYTSSIMREISALQRDHVELLLRKQFTVAAVYHGRPELHKSAAINDAFAQCGAIIKSTLQPTQLFGLLSIDGSWASHLATGIVFALSSQMGKLVIEHL